MRLIFIKITLQKLIKCFTGTSHVAFVVLGAQKNGITVKVLNSSLLPALTPKDLVNCVQVATVMYRDTNLLVKYISTKLIAVAKVVEERKILN